MFGALGQKKKGNESNLTCQCLQPPLASLSSGLQALGNQQFKFDSKEKILILISSLSCYFNCVYFVSKHGSLGKTEYVYYRKTHPFSLVSLEAEVCLYGEKVEKEGC